MVKLPNILIATDFACGGICVTMLNDRPIVWNSRLKGSIDGDEHNGLKDLKSFDLNFKYAQPGVWYHTHEETIPLEYFNKKLIITTEDIKSRYIIFLRCQKFKNPDWIENDTMESIDKIRELAKEYAIPRITKTQPGCKSIELVDLINENHELFDTDHITWKTWKKENMYLYETHDWLQKRFDEAVWEIENQQYYRYH